MSEQLMEADISRVGCLGVWTVWVAARVRSFLKPDPRPTTVSLRQYLIEQGRETLCIRSPMTLNMIFRGISILFEH